MKRKLTFLFLIFCFCFINMTSIHKVSADVPKNTYKEIDGKLYYYDGNGKVVIGFYTMPDGTRCYFSKAYNGGVKSGKLKIGKYEFIIGEKGEVKTGFIKYNGKLYFCSKNGILRKGWYNNKKYYFGEDGIIKSGFQKIENKTYYLSKYGKVLRNAWITVGGEQYYLDADGQTMKGWQTIDNKRYYFLKTTGVMQTGWVDYGNYTYYLGDDGVKRTGWTKIDGKYYCLSSAKGILRRNVWVNGKFVCKEGYWVKNLADYFHPIMGTSTITVEQMVKLYKEHATYPTKDLKPGGASNITAFCKILISEAEAEDVRADVLYAQIMHETGWLKFGGDVQISQYNFGGLGATGGGVTGNSFKNVRYGIRAQVQHLKAYASELPLNKTCVDKRYTFVEKGCAPYIEWLGIPDNPTGNGWASGARYGDYLLSVINMLNETEV